MVATSRLCSAEHPEMQRDGALRYIEGFAPIPLQYRAITAQMKLGLS